MSGAEWWQAECARLRAELEVLALDARLDAALAALDAALGAT